jgi:hypothetical protein
MLETNLHFISAIVIFLAAIVPIYLTLKLKNNIRKLTLILTIFILTHAVYHIVGFYGLTLLGEGVFEPLSVAVLIFFGIIYSGFAKPKNMGVKNSMVVVWESWNFTSPHEQHYNIAAFGSFGYICMAGSAISEYQKFSVSNFNIYNNLDFRRDNWYSSG